jgi:DNA-binding response OmpR family regulator
MPNFDVADLLRKIRADPDVGGTPVLLFTASLQDEELWKAVDADGIIRKPFDAAKLERTIRAHLRRRA